MDEYTMPSKKWSSKKWSKKPSMAKAKKAVTKQRKAKAKKNMDTFFFKSKVETTLIPTQAVTVANYIYNTFSLDPTGTNAQYLSNGEFNLYRGLYDKFRVNSVKVTFVPKANVLDQANAQNDGTLNTSGDGMIHHVVDRDGSAPSNTARLTRYPSYRRTSVLKKFSRIYSVKYPMGIWIDCQSPGTFSMTDALGLKGGVTIYAENVLEDNGEVFNEPWASVIIEHNIVFQGKTSGVLGGVYDQNDPPNLIGVSVGFSEYDANVSQSVLRNVRGTLASDTRLTGTTVAIAEDPITDQGTA